MADFSRHEVFSFHTHANLHRSIPRIIHGSQKPEEIPHIHGRIEIHAIDRRGHGIGIRVPGSDDPGSIIDISQYDSAMYVPGKIRVLVRHLIYDGNKAVSDIFGLHAGASSNLIVSVRLTFAKNLSADSHGLPRCHGLKPSVSPEIRDHAGAFPEFAIGKAAMFSLGSQEENQRRDLPDALPARSFVVRLTPLTQE